MLQLALNLVDQLFAPTVDLVLGIEQGPTAPAAFGFDRLNLLLTGELLFQREGCHCGSPGFFDLPVEFLNLSL